MENLRNSNNKSSNGKGKFSKFAPILAGALFLMNPNGVYAQNNTSNKNRMQAEVSTSTILDRLNQKVGVSLPAEYNGKVLDFVLNDTIMRTKSATAYTEEFIVNEMKKNWGISKENQLLFIRSSIYGGISKDFLYDRLEDDNEVRSNEYEKALKEINESYEEYKKGFKIYMEAGIADADRRSADADRRSAEADKRSAEAIQETMKLDSIRIGNNLEEFYETYIKNTDIVKQEEIDFMKKRTKEVIEQCNKYGIDYKAILMKEVGDKKKVDAILKFYGVE